MVVDAYKSASEWLLYASSNNAIGEWRAVRSFNMKNFLKVIEIIALVAVAGFSMIACPSNGGNTPGGNSNPGGNGGNPGGNGGEVGSSGFAYELIDNGTAYRVRKGTVTGGAVVIPAAYNGLPVTEIGSADDEQTNFAFFNSGITGVSIPASITSIGFGAFYFCEGLTSISIPASVKEIGDYAFAYCTGFDSLIIPNSVTTIGQQSFWGCEGLTAVTIGSGVRSIGRSAFQDCKSLTSIIIPNSVTSIDVGAFAYCTALASVTIPASVTSISQGIFTNCTSLASVTFAAGSAISSDNFNSYSSFPGDLRSKYLAAGGGAGTYTRTIGESAWTKQ